jgi:hypothetical protein
MAYYINLHPALIHYLTDYTLPRFITWIITSCHDPLHVPLHVPLHAPESITCSRIHYMQQVFTIVNIFAAAAAQRSLHRPAACVTAACVINRLFSVGFNS